MLCWHNYEGKSIARAALEAARFRATPACELNETVRTHHILTHFAGCRWSWTGGLRGEAAPPTARRCYLAGASRRPCLGARAEKGELHIFLQPGLVERVTAEAFDLDPAR